MKTRISYLTITRFVATSLLPLNSYAHELILSVDKIKTVKGVLMIALYNSASSYTSDVNTFVGKKIEVTDKTINVNVGDIPAGEYAIKLFHDENSNGVIDKNLIGIPTEGYGFSNNGGAMGQPSFSDAKFTVDGNTLINIHLR